MMIIMMITHNGMMFSLTQKNFKQIPARLIQAARDVPMAGHGPWRSLECEQLQMNRTDSAVQILTVRRTLQFIGGVFVQTSGTKLRQAVRVSIYIYMYIRIVSTEFNERSALGLTK